MKIMIIKQLIQNWVHVDSVVKTHPFTQEIIGVTTEANFLGEDNSDPGSTGKNIYTDPQNLPTAISTILKHSQNKADFHPATAKPEYLIGNYNHYIHEIDANPFLFLDKHDQRGGRFDSSDYNKLIDEIVNLYEGVSSENKDKIRRSIANMGKAVFTQAHSERWANLFSQATIDFSNMNEPKYYLYYTTLYMKKSDNGKDGIEEHQSYTVNRTTYKVLTPLIKAHATTLAALNRASVDQWMHLNSTPERENAKLCFDVFN